MKSQSPTGILRARDLCSGGLGAKDYPWGAGFLHPPSGGVQGMFWHRVRMGSGVSSATSSRGNREPQLPGSREGPIPRTNDMGMRSVERLQY